MINSNTYSIALQKAHTFDKNIDIKNVRKINNFDNKPNAYSTTKEITTYKVLDQISKSLNKQLFSAIFAVN